MISIDLTERRNAEKNILNENMSKNISQRKYLIISNDSITIMYLSYFFLQFSVKKKLAKITFEYRYCIQITSYLPSCSYRYFYNDQQARVGVSFYFHLVCYYEGTITYAIRVTHY
jgi:hypothetical protein